MGISLDVADYCHNCPDFESVVNKNTMTIYDMGHRPYELTNTVICCVNRKRCENIYRTMKNLKGEEK